MTEKLLLADGTVQRSRAGYHILGGDGTAYAVNEDDWHNLQMDCKVGAKRYLLGRRVQFTPSKKTNRRGLPYANHVGVSLSASLAAQERERREMNAIRKTLF